MSTPNPNQPNPQQPAKPPAAGQPAQRPAQPQPPQQQPAKPPAAGQPAQPARPVQPAQPPARPAQQGQPAQPPARPATPGTPQVPIVVPTRQTLHGVPSPVQQGQPPAKPAAPAAQQPAVPPRPPAPPAAGAQAARPTISGVPAPQPGARPPVGQQPAPPTARPTLPPGTPSPVQRPPAAPAQPPAGVRPPTPPTPTARPTISGMPSPAGVRPPPAAPAQPPRPVAQQPAAPPRPPATPAQPPRPAAQQPVAPAQPPRPVAQQPAVPAKPPAAPPRPAAAPPAAAKPSAPPAKAPVKPGAPPAQKPAAAGGKGSPLLTGKNKLGQVLVDLGYIEEEQLQALLKESQQTGRPVGELALGRGMITEDQMVQALSEHHGLKVVALNELKPQPEAITMVPETMAKLYKLLPLIWKDNVLTIVLADPGNLSALDDMRNLLGIKHVQAVLASAKSIDEAIVKYYQGKEENIVDIIKELESAPKLRSSHRETSIDIEELIEQAESAPIRKLINMVFLMAIRDHASDIHFEPFEEEYKMRYRCDGVLVEMVPPPRHLAMAIASRIKVMANLDIAERRLPQDGRIELTIGGSPLDMRVSVLPTMFGESVVIRVLDRTVVNLDLDRCGLEPQLLAKFRELIHKPNGIVLVTGPTGAGKTTTLYSALSELNQITEKIITTEDPVEYEIDGICQVPINADIDMTFANALRSILRQDPDIILVGEIRDLETAQIAVQASLTGHLVFSTLHTNDAASTITRLRDMGVEPYLLTATLEGILAQRLVRKICTECRTVYEPSQEQLMELNLRPQDVKGKKFYYGAGCPRCNNTGFKGRSGLFELIAMNDALRDVITQGGSIDALRNAVRTQGVIGLRESGLRAVFAGVTTIDEVVRETVLEDDI